MSRADKKLKRWFNNPPKDVPKEEVLAIVKRFFPGQHKQKSGSHIVIQDDRLIGIPGYGPEGDFDIPIKGGQRVKGFYLKRLASTIKLLEEIKEWKEKT